MPNRSVLICLIVTVLLTGCLPASGAAGPSTAAASQQPASLVVITADEEATTTEQYAQGMFALLGLSVHSVQAAAVTERDIPLPAASQYSGWFMTFEAARKLSPEAIDLLDERLRAGAKGLIVEIDGPLGDLAVLTGNRVQGAVPLPPDTLSISRFSEFMPEFSQELTAVEFGHGTPQPGMYLQHEADESVVPVIRVTGEVGVTDGLPRLLAVKRDAGTILLQAASPNPAVIERPLRVLLAGGQSFGQIYVDAMLEAIPPVLFARYVGGDAAWHNPRRLANFTVDGPPLVQPFWNEPFTERFFDRILERARSKGFHVTFATTPEHLRVRSDEVIGLLRANPDYLSVAVRGRSEVCPTFPVSLSEKDLLASVRDVRQQMESFRTRSGVPYGPVMVFPCDAYATRDLAALERWNFMAASSSVDPHDAGPIPWEFQMARVGQFSDGVPLVSRQVVTASAAALDFALDRPTIVYETPMFFQGSYEAFDSWADQINRTPDVTWASLGEVLRRHVWQKRNPDGTFSARLFFADAILENPSDEQRTYLVHFPDDGRVPVERVLVDGRNASFQVEHGVVRLRLTIGPRSERSIVIRYREPAPGEY